MRTILFSAFLLAPLVAAARAAEPSELQETQERLKAVEERLGKLEGAPAKTSLSAFNPAMGIALDFVTRHSDDKASFLFRAAEVNIEAPIDPFLKGWAVINGSEGGVEVEEAALKTTALPYNLTVAGGRLFASFGRLAHFHDHELPVVERPRSLDAFIGGETQADGLEVSYLFPTELYLNAVLGIYNKIGGENDRAGNAAARPLDEFTYLARLSTYKDVGDSHSLELGVSSAWTPKRTVVEDVTVTGSADALITRKNTWRTLSGADLTYRYQPSQGGIYRGLLWSAEVLQNDERRFEPSTRLPNDRVLAYSGFTYLQAKMGRLWRIGAMADLAEDPDRARALTRTYSGILTWDVTEFQRLRLVYSRSSDNVPGSLGNNTVALQWTGVLGHHVHGFRDR